GDPILAQRHRLGVAEQVEFHASFLPWAGPRVPAREATYASPAAPLYNNESSSGRPGAGRGPCRQPGDLGMKRNDIRNVAIIAHVDHGKTTLVDQILRQSGLFRESELVGECILDSNELERQRGITILAKNVAFKIGDTKVNLIDTPGHADFGGEVERVLKMADGAFLLVDAAEGPLPQTRFVLRKAFACGLRPIVVINKIDRPDARPAEVLNAVFDLFVELGAAAPTLASPILNPSGRRGAATPALAVPARALRLLYDAILRHVPPPEVQPDKPLQMLVVSIDHSEYVGRIGIGKVFSGKVRKGQKVALLKRDGKRVDDTVVQVLEFDRLGRREVTEGGAGD